MTRTVDIYDCACYEPRALMRWACDHLGVPQEQTEALEGMQLAKRQGWVRQPVLLTAVPSHLCHRTVVRGRRTQPWILRTTRPVSRQRSGQM